MGAKYYRQPRLTGPDLTDQEFEYTDTLEQNRLDYPRTN
jgi:hypothetical protein